MVEISALLLPSMFWALYHKLQYCLFIKVLALFLGPESQHTKLFLTVALQVKQILRSCSGFWKLGSNKLILSVVMFVFTCLCLCLLINVKYRITNNQDLHQGFPIVCTL